LMRFPTLPRSQKLPRNVSCRIAASGDRLAIRLTGGSLPKQALYLAIARDRCLSNPDPLTASLGVSATRRFVPAPPRSTHNMGMARQDLLVAGRLLPLHPSRLDTTADPTSRAEIRERVQTFYGAAQLDPALPFFYVVSEWRRPDFHTASLFPYIRHRSDGALVMGVRRRSVEAMRAACVATLAALNSASKCVRGTVFVKARDLAARA